MSGSFLSELRRRNVLRVAMAYAAVAWLLVQIAETVMPLYGFSEAAIRTIVTVLAVGFIPALILAWVFEWTPEGLQKEEDVRAGVPRDTRWLDRGIIITLLIAVTYFAVDKWLLQPEPTHFGDKSIAVLPFDNLSDDPAQDYFGLGIAEEMLNLLALIPELQRDFAHVVIRGGQPGAGHLGDRRAAGCRPRSRRLGAQGRKRDTDHGAAHRGRNRFAHLVRHVGPSTRRRFRHPGRNCQRSRQAPGSDHRRRNATQRAHGPARMGPGVAVARGFSWRSG